MERKPFGQSRLILSTTSGSALRLVSFTLPHSSRTTSEKVIPSTCEFSLFLPSSLRGSSSVGPVPTLRFGDQSESAFSGVMSSGRESWPSTSEDPSQTM